MSADVLLTPMEMIDVMNQQLNLLIHHCQNHTVLDSGVVRQYVYRLEEMMDALVKGLHEGSLH